MRRSKPRTAFGSCASQTLIPALPKYHSTMLHTTNRYLTSIAESSEKRAYGERERDHPLHFYGMAERKGKGKGKGDFSITFYSCGMERSASSQQPAAAGQPNHGSTRQPFAVQVKKSLSLQSSVSKQQSRRKLVSPERIPKPTPWLCLRPEWMIEVFKTASGKLSKSGPMHNAPTS